MPALGSERWHVRALRPLRSMLSWIEFLVGDLVCQTVHIVCLISQALILAVGAYGFVSCGDDMGFSENHCSSNSARIQLPWSASLMGMVAGIANLVYLNRISTLEKRDTDSTGRQQRLQKLSTLGVGMLLNIILMLVNFSIMRKAHLLAAGRWAHLHILATMEMIGGVLLILTLILHACKLYRVLRQRSQVYEVLNNLENGFEDEFEDFED